MVGDFAKKNIPVSKNMKPPTRSHIYVYDICMCHHISGQFVKSH